ncbi:hypothetical protein Glove_150g58 [Diversispora epigaea]|uniref:Uncharacterized protein n=1 Tax=Diversispora epigaea TaxID=1348612 RepID=A0A397J1V1_9GLOM|nr:hypothetical protein Glove_150g58 [Diversispora epigaea]
MAALKMKRNKKLQEKDSIITIPNNEENEKNFFTIDININENEAVYTINNSSKTNHLDNNNNNNNNNI